MSAELPNWVLEVRPPSGGRYTIFLDLGSWCVKRGRYGDPTLKILFKGTKEDAESYVNFLAATDSSCLAYDEETQLLCRWNSAFEFLEQTMEGLELRAGYTKDQEASYIAELRHAEAPVLEILTELRSMLKARKAQPALPMECEP